MALTVSQRIGWGFAASCGFLLAVAATALLGMNKIRGDLEAVADQAAPMVVSAGDLSTALLESSRAMGKHFNGRSDEILQAAHTEFDAALAKYQKSHAELQTLVGEDEDLQRGLTAVDQLAKAYFDGAPQVFSLHEEEIGAQKAVKKMRNNFEDLADDLDGQLSDMADSGKANLRAAAKKAAALVGEGTVTAVDALAMQNLASLATASKELDSLSGSIANKLSELKAGDAEADVLEQLAEYQALISGPKSLAQTYRSQMTSAEAARTGVEASEGRLNESLQALQAELEKVNAFKEQAKASANAAIASATGIMVLVSILACVVAGVVAVRVTRSIKQPLHETVNVIDQLARGDLTARVNVDKEDEFGQLAESVNRLTGQLRSMLQNIANTAQSLTQSAESTSGISRTTHAAIRHQREQTERVVLSMSEMTTTVHDVAQSAAQTLSQVSQANAETSAGRQVVMHSIEAINRLAGEVQSSVGVINNLQENSAQIGSVLDVIRGIAEQTNLLALNAAIEAARAGEQGRGFAVVADEVRTLASRTQKSTQEIQQMIERLQKGAQDAVQVMARSQREAELSVAQTAKAGESLERITQSMGVINDMSMHIASAAEQQTAVSREINSNMGSIASATEQTAAGAQQTLSSSQELAQFADALQKLVQQFRI